MNLSLSLQLKESNARLLGLETSLDLERDDIVNHPAVNYSVNNSSHFGFLSSVEKYTGFADKYYAELLIFKQLLRDSVNEQKSKLNEVNNISPAINTADIDITSNQLTLSTPVADTHSNILYSNQNSNISITSVSDVDNKSYIKNEPEIEREPENVEPVQYKAPEPEQKKVVKPVKSSAKVKMVKAKVVNRMNYVYGGKGFQVWKKNGQRPIYTETELICLKSFGDDEEVQVNKLKKWLIKRGGFKAHCVESITVETYGDKKECLVKVRDSVERIDAAIDEINKGRKKEIIYYSYKPQYSSSWKEKTRKLFVNGFDILSENDHRLMTSMFCKFGGLERDIFMNRDKNGNPFAMIEFKELSDAVNCERNQNFYNNRKPLRFNGKLLQIQYVDERRMGQRKNNRKNKKSRKY